MTATLTLPKTWSWCSDPRLLAWKADGAIYHMPARYAGRNESCVPFEITTNGSSDGSMPVGNQPWNLCFVRTSDGWRLYDQGQG